MLLYILLFAVFVISEQSENKTVLPVDDKILHSNLHLSNKTKLSMVSEGGTLLPNTLDMSLSKTNFTSYLSIDEELDKTKEKSSVPRKGVDNNLMPTELKDPHLSSNDSAILDEKISDSKNSSVSLLETKDISKSSDTVTSKNQTVELKNLNQTTVHKKPLILSYEALANMEKNIKIDQSKIPIVPSSKTIASSQIPSPNEDKIIKVYPSKANSHPGMVMPIIITILVVPMFAILGYMALKRGQEAWKNRHYKRMDFLLDGMYND